MPGAIITEKARHDLAAIKEYIEADNPIAANKLINDILKKCDAYASNPRIGTLSEEYGKSIRRFSFGRYVILYRPVEDSIAVLHIWHGARDLPEVSRREGLE